MDNLKEIFDSQDSSDEVTDYTKLLGDIEAQIIVVNDDNSKLIAYGNSIEDVIEHVSEGIVVYLPSKDTFFAGSNL